MIPSMDKAVLDALWGALVRAAERGTRVQLLVGQPDPEACLRLFELFGENIEIRQACDYPAWTEDIVDGKRAYVGPPLATDFEVGGD